MLTLLVCAQWQGRSERGFLRFAWAYWRSYFPRLLDQSAFTRRARDLTGATTQLVPLVAAELGATVAPYQVIDGWGCRCPPEPWDRPPPVRRRGGARARWSGQGLVLRLQGAAELYAWGRRHRLRGRAGRHRGALAGRGLGLLARGTRGPTLGRTAPSPAPDHKRGGRHRGPTGPIWPRDGAGQPTTAPSIADLGYRGAHWQVHWHQDYGATILTADTYQGDEAPQARRQHHARRQIIETVNGLLERVFHRHFPNARSRWGLRTRLAAKLLALNLGIWLNIQFERKPLALPTLFAA